MFYYREYGINKYSFSLIIGGFAGQPLKCASQRASFAKNNLPMEPEFDAECRFLPKQCGKKECWCVDVNSGRITSDGAIDKDASCTSECTLNEIRLLFTFVSLIT